MEGMSSIKSFLDHASIFFWINALLISPIAFAVILERLFVLLKKSLASSKEFWKNVERYVLANDITQAVNYCNTSSTPLSMVLKAGLTKANRGGMAVSMAIDEALLQVTPQIEKRIGSLWSFANIATLLGLIGTIYGLITSFSGLTEASPELKAKILGVGISEALFNTMTGLSIAVSCILFHLILSGIAKRIMNDLDYYSSRLENLLSLRGGE